MMTLIKVTFVACQAAVGVFPISQIGHVIPASGKTHQTLISASLSRDMTNSGIPEHI